MSAATEISPVLKSVDRMSPLEKVTFYASQAIVSWNASNAKKHQPNGRDGYLRKYFEVIEDYHSDCRGMRDEFLQAAAAVGGGE